MSENREKRCTRANKLAVAALAGSVLLLGQSWSAVIPYAYAADAADSNTATVPILALLDEQIVSTGVTLRSYQWNGAAVRVIAADLSNPYVKLDVMTGQTGQYPKRDTVLNMSRQTGAVAGINADFFDPSNSLSSPFGPQVSDNIFMGSPLPALSGMYAFGITKDNKPVIDLFQFKGTVTAANGQSFSFSVFNKTPGPYAMAMYTSAWGSKIRGSNEKYPPSEVAVENGIVTQVSIGAPIDALPPANGYILHTGTDAGAGFIAANVKVGEPITAAYTLTSTAPAGTPASAVYTQDSFKMLVGGHTILVDQGKPAAFSRDVSSISGTRSRSVAGFSQDGRYVYLVSVERSGGAGGLRLGDLQQLLTQLGVWKAVNLDGGGSATLASRPLGEFEAKLANNPEDGSLRKVVNGIGVYTTAPAAPLKGLIIGGASLLWKGETSSYQVKAYDSYYNPLNPAALPQPPVWNVLEGGAIATADGDITATAAGTAMLSVKSGAVEQKQAVEVADSNAIVKLSASAATPPELWKAGSTYDLTVTATLRDGRERAIPPALVRWERIGVAGAMLPNGALQFAGFAEGAKDAMLVARYDGYSTRLTVPVPNTKLITDFESVPWGVTFDNYPSMVNGGVALTDAYNPADKTKSLALRYDFTAGDDTTDKAAYAKFNGDQGVTLNGDPTALLADIYSDGNAAWLRAEFADKDGNIIRKTLSDKLDWTGWRNVSVNLADTGAVKLKRVYLVSKAQMSGEIAIDNLTLVLPQQAEASNTQVKMTVGKTDVLVSGETQKLDQPPVVENNRTFVPVRFIVDALGGNVSYNQTEKKVTIRKGTHFIELWLGKQDFIADGERVTSDVSPLVRKGRTLLPIRAVSEELGLKINWVQETKEITIQEE